MPGSPQHEFLVDDLKTAARATWKLVFFHYPPYVSGAFQVEGRSRKLFLQCGFAAIRAVGQRIIGKLLDGLELVATLFTLVFVNRHVSIPFSRLHTRWWRTDAFQ